MNKNKRATPRIAKDIRKMIPCCGFENGGRRLNYARMPAWISSCPRANKTTQQQGPIEMTHNAA